MNKNNFLIITITSVILGCLLYFASYSTTIVVDTKTQEEHYISNAQYSGGEYTSRLKNINTINLYSSNMILVDNPFEKTVTDEISYQEYSDVNDYNIAGFSLYVEDQWELSSFHKSSIDNAIEELKSLYATPSEYENIINKTVKPLTGNGTLTTDLWLKEDYKIVFEPVVKSETLDEQQTIDQLIFGTTNPETYVVKEGENPQFVALENNVPFQQFANYNEINEETLLYPDQELVVSPVDSPFTVSAQVDNLAVENIPYETTYQKTSSLDKGENKTEQAGENGAKNVYVTSIYDNNILDPNSNEILYTSIIKEPVNKVVSQGTYVAPKVEEEEDEASAEGDGITTGSLAWPADGGYVMCGWYCYPGHQGIDIGHGYTLNIRAADGGTVISAGYSGDYGNRVVIQHSNGLKTVYAHMSSIGVYSGQSVSKGQVIGQMGMTGRATAVHLHFEVISGGVKQNPLNYL